MGATNLMLPLALRWTSNPSRRRMRGLARVDTDSLLPLHVHYTDMPRHSKHGYPFSAIYVHYRMHISVTVIWGSVSAKTMSSMHFNNNNFFSFRMLADYSC